MRPETKLTERENKVTSKTPDLQTSDEEQKIEVALLTGGADRPYAFGLATALVSKGIILDIVGSDDLDSPEFHGNSGVNFLNLRGDQRPDAGLIKKVGRVLRYYARLIRYAATAEPRIFHILWNNKVEAFDRTLLMLYYRALGKRVVLTVHNVNAARRDTKDSLLNRLTLRVQYRLADHTFVHSDKMKYDLHQEFGVHAARVTVIPFGINNAVPNTSLTRIEARKQLGIGNDEKTILFFGNIAPYKGLEYLVTAFQKSLTWRSDCRLIIAGRPKNCPRYWADIRQLIQEDVREGKILLNENYIPDEDTEIYFKAADVLVLPYRYIYQSGVLFLGYSFGLPVIAADVGSLREDIVESQTGFVFKPEDPADLARIIEGYFESNLFANLDKRRREICEYASERHSWDVVGKATLDVYAALLKLYSSNQGTARKTRPTILDTNTPS
jgi:D-inositol-3-phosphate glycosyltransferase